MPDQGLNLTDKLRRAFNILKADKTDTYIQVGNVTTFGIQVQRGLVPAFSGVRVEGNNSDLDAGVEETVWNGGGVYQFPATAEVLDIVSTDTNDTSAGTGARTVIIQGLDVNFDELTETVSMNGTTIVNTTGSFLRINKATVDTVGTVGGSNLGTITITHGVNLVSQIDIGQGVALNGFFTVPNNREFYVVSAAIQLTGQLSGSTSVREAVLNATVTPFGKATRIVAISAIRSDGAPLVREFSLPIKFEEKTDVKISATSSSNNTSITVNVSIFSLDTTI